MKTGKEDEKMMGPMFPRLHVNDTDRGGPRAPPRNKMALYEQLSVPSQRFNSGGRTPINSNSGIQGSDHERGIASPLRVSLSNTASRAEKPRTFQLSSVNLSSSLDQMQTGKKVGDEDDFRVPIFLHSDSVQHGSNQSGVNGEKVAPFSPICHGHSKKLAHLSDRSSSGKNLKQTASMGPVSGVRSQGTVDPKEISTGQYSVDDAARHKIDIPNKAVAASSVPELRYHLLTDNDRPCETEASLQQDCSIRSQPQGPMDTKKIDASNPRRNSHMPEGRSQRISHQLVGNREYPREKLHGPLCTDNVDRSDDISEASMVDSLSTFEISPDDVVGIIGYKHFLKARKEIVNQQRVFAVQVFELHRLIKVQRLIAGSPELLVENAAYLTKPTLKVSPAKKLRLEYVMKPSSCVAKEKNNSEKPNHSVERSAENGVKASVKNTSQLQRHGNYMGNSRPVPIAPDPKMAPWWHQQPSGKQWLVPVMSPSEGLIYKPYVGSSFMGPGCGGYGPMGVGADLLAQGHINSPAYGIPPSFPYQHHPQGVGVFPVAPPAGHGYGYFPPYGMPVMNPAISGSVVEQIDPFSGQHSHSHPARSQGVGIDSSLQQQSSCNMRSNKNCVMSPASKIPSPRGSEVQGSTASSLSETARRTAPVPVFRERDELPLFPLNPTIPEEVTQGHGSPDCPTRVIRVVPHNPRSATESAARIFQSIQEERKQFDSS